MSIIRARIDGEIRYDDELVPLLAARPNIAAAPGLVQMVDNGAGSVGVYSLAFDKTTAESMFFSIQIPHKWKEGTELCPHIHWAPSDTDTGGVVWGLEYSIATHGAVFPASTIDTVGQVANGNALEHQIAEFAHIVMTGNKISTLMQGRIFRDAGDGSDTYDADAFGINFDLHIAIDDRGSQEEWVK